MAKRKGNTKKSPPKEGKRQKTLDLYFSSSKAEDGEVDEFILEQEQILKELQSKREEKPKDSKSEVSKEEIKVPQHPQPNMDLYLASMILAGVGDCLGYKNGTWEFCYDGHKIMDQVNKLGGILNIEVEPIEFRVSDDTVMLIATAKALVANWNEDVSIPRSHQFQKLYKYLCQEYVECWGDMKGRAPGKQCEAAMRYLRRGEWNKIKFSNSGGGCGASMRTSCIGLYFWRPEQLDDLIAVSIESGRMTHNHPTGFYGGVAAALFTSYALQKIPIHKWGHMLIKDVLPKCLHYLKHCEPRDFNTYEEHEALNYFEEQFKKYLRKRKILDGKSKPVFPKDYNLDIREKYYKDISFSGWGGSSGHDSIIISYDALLFSEGDWETFCINACVHGGDSDSTGAIGGSWFGAFYGLTGVPTNHYLNLEKREEIEELAIQIYEKAS